MKELELSALGERCYYETLPNGLTVYVVPKTGLSKCYAILCVNYGGSDEVFWQGNRRKQTPAGVAHFLEHKMFEMPEGNALQTLTARGASPNAFTSNRITGYHFSCTDHFYDNLRTLLNFVSTPYFTAESVAKEQGIIGQEIGMLNDIPGWRGWNAMVRGLFHNHPVRNDLAGTVDSIGQITPEILESCYRGFYRGDNMVLCVAGNVDARQVFQLAAATVPAPEGQPARRDIGETEPETALEQQVVLEMDVSAPKFFFGCKAHAECDLKSKLLGELTAQLLCGPATPLYAKLYEEGLIDDGFQCDYSCGNGAGFFAFAGESRDPDAVAEAILGEGIRIAWNGLDGKLFERVKRGAYGKRVMALDSLEQLCGVLARGHFEGYNYLDFASVWDSLAKEDAEELIRDCITGDRSTLAIVRPKGGN